jgi:hypothetical protein
MEMKPSVKNYRAGLALSWGALILVLIVSFWLRSQYLWVRGLTYDEGIVLMFGQLVNAGYPAYSETFVSWPPLALLTIQLGTAIFGSTLALRYPMMLFSLVGIGSLFWWFRPEKSIRGLIAGLIASVLLSFTSFYFSESILIMVEAPAIAMSLLSLTLAQQYYLRGRFFWLAFSGLAFAFSLALKIFIIFLPVLIGYLILLGALAHRNKTSRSLIQQMVIGGGIWTLGVIIPLLGLALIYNPWDMYQQMFAFRFAYRDYVITEQGVTPIQNFRRIVQFIWTYSPLFLGAIGAVLVGWRKYRLSVLIWSLWFFLAVILLTWQIPMWHRYLGMLIPPLAALSGLLTAICVHWLSHKLETRGNILRWMAVTLLLGIVLILGMAQAVKSAFSPPFSDTSHYIFDYLTNELKDAVDYARTNTTVHDCLIADDQRFAIATERLVPPSLSETSAGRLRTGWMIDATDVRDEAAARDCAMVVYVTKRFRKFLPDLPEYLREMYFLEINYNDRRIYTAKKNITRRPDILLDESLGDVVALKGIDLSPIPWQPGQKAQLAAYWSAYKPLDNAYKIFGQLRNDKGEVVVSFDHFPFPVPHSRYRFLPDVGGQYRITPHIDDIEYSTEDIVDYPNKGMVPTNLWPIGNTIREVTTMNIPASLAPGIYHLYIGMYDPDTLVRLPTTNDSSEILAASVEIAASD